MPSNQFKHLTGDPRQLRSISVFFRNDKPNGLGFTLQAPNLDVASTYMSAFDHGIETYDQHYAQGDCDPTVLIGQLEQFGRQKQKSEHDVVIAFKNIIWLELRGFIASNEFNGAVWVWSEEVA